MPCHSQKKVCKHCVLRELDHICDHLNDIPIVTEEIFDLDFTKNNKPRKEKLACPICQDRIPQGSPTYRTPCDHRFHAHCFLLHSLRSEDCPQ